MWRQAGEVDAPSGPEARLLGAPGLPKDLADLQRVADEQFRLLTRPQCRAAGMSDAAIAWRLERGWWVRLHLGVYLTVPGRDGWWIGAVAAQLAVEDAVWSHQTAAF